MKKKITLIQEAPQKSRDKGHTSHHSLREMTPGNTFLLMFEHVFNLHL